MRRRRRWLIAGVGLLITATLAAHAARRSLRWDRLTARPMQIVDLTAVPVIQIRPAGDSAKPTTVRLCGVAIDAAQMPQVIEWMTTNLNSPIVRLALDARRAYADGETVEAYVYLQDGRMLNELLIEQGMARADSSSSHLLVEWFGKLEAGARQRRRGLWAEGQAGSNQ